MFTAGRSLWTVRLPPLSKVSDSLNPANPPLRLNWIVQFAGVLQAELDWLVGVSKGSGRGLFAGIPPHDDSKMLIKRMGIIFDICEPMDFLLDLII